MRSRRPAAAGRIHVDPDIGRAGGEVEARIRVVRVQQPRDLVHRRAHAGHVRGRGKRADPEPSVILGLTQQLLEVREIHAAIGGEIHLDHGRETLPPGHFIRVMLVGPDEHDRLARLLVAAKSSYRSSPRNSRSSSPTALRVAGGRNTPRICCSLSIAPVAPVPQATMRPCGPAFTERLIASLRLVQQPAHAAAGQVVLGVRVRVHALQRLQVALDEHEAAAGRRVVAVHHQAAAERRVEGGVDPDDLAAKKLEAPVLHGADCTRRQNVEEHSPISEEIGCPYPRSPWTDGSHTRTASPPPSRLARSMVPPCASTISRQSVQAETRAVRLGGIERQQRVREYLIAHAGAPVDDLQLPAASTLAYGYAYLGGR